MNTCWLHSEKKVKLKNNIELFKNMYDVKKICEKLEIDIDEFYTCFNSNIKREYYM